MEVEDEMCMELWYAMYINILIHLFLYSTSFEVSLLFGSIYFRRGVLLLIREIDLAACRMLYVLGDPWLSAGPRVH